MGVARSPTDSEINKWWQWAAGFKKRGSPFGKGWGNGNIDRTKARQSGNIYCLSCTAGFGGIDPVSRPLKAAIESKNNIIVPVFVACEEDRSMARRLVGTDGDNFNPKTVPAVYLFIDHRQDSWFYKENQISNVDFVPENSFEEKEAAIYPTNRLWSVGYWAKVPPRVQKIEFGGKGGSLLSDPDTPFETGVTYEL